MKKTVIIVLALMMIFSITGTVLAVGIFSDVLSGSWVYDDLKQLQKTGIITGYAADEFNGDKVKSRYELAIVVGRAVENSAKANAEQKDLIAKLQKEFSNELAKIDVSVPVIPEKTASLANRFSFNGFLSVRYAHVAMDDVTDATQGMQQLVGDLTANVKINDIWSGHFSQRHYLFWGDKSQASEMTELDQWMGAWLTGKIGDVGVTLGSAGPYLGDCLAIGYGMNGIKLDYGSNVKTTVFYGEVTGQGYFANGNDATNGDSADIYGVSINANVTKTTNVNLLVGANSETAEGQSRAAEVVVKQQLAPDWTIKGGYARTDADDYNNNYRYTLQYKQMDCNINGSYDLFVTYGKIQRNGSMNSSCADDNWGLWQTPDAFSYSAADDSSIYSYMKGYILGFDYQICKNISMQALYYSQKLGALADGSEKGRDVYRAFITYLF